MTCDLDTADKLEETLRAERAAAADRSSDASESLTASSSRDPIDKLRRELTDLDLIMPQRSARSEGYRAHSFLFSTVGADASDRRNPLKSSKDNSSTYIPELGTSF